MLGVFGVVLFIGADVFSPGAIFTRTTLEQASHAIQLVSDGLVANWYTMLAAIALITESKMLTVVHLPQVIYHRHPSRPTTPADAPRCEIREAAMTWLVDSLATGASVEPVVGFPGLLRAHWPLPEVLPKVSIIIPTRDQIRLLRTCVEGVLTGTDYPNMEVIIVDNDSSDPNTLAYLEELKRRGVIILPHPYPFNYPAVNNRAAEIATGEYVCLLNNDIEILNSNWLKELASNIFRRNIGIVGAKLLWPNKMVQHAGVIIGTNGLASHAGNHIADADEGYLGLNQLTHSVTAVTGACLLISRLAYLDQGGMDEHALPIAFNDVDLCMRVRETGMKIVWAAQSILIHAESASRGKDSTKDRIARAQREQLFFIKAWTESYQTDPYYHPSLSRDYLTGPYNGLSLPPLNYPLITKRIYTPYNNANEGQQKKRPSDHVMNIQAVYRQNSPLQQIDSRRSSLPPLRGRK